MLKNFIQSEIYKPFEWGKTDCCSTVDRWVKLKTATSPLEFYGRQVLNEFEGKKWLTEKGGIIKACERVIKNAGFKVTKTPEVGDIGLIVVYENQVCMAIKCENFWFSRDENGIIGAPLNCRVLKSWKI